MVNLEFTTNDLHEFMKIYKTITEFTNDGGMKSPDMFTLFLTLKRIQPKLVIESGVWRGASTRLIRETLGPDTQIVCLDPRPQQLITHTDDNERTIYCVGDSFIDFGNLLFKGVDTHNALAFFDDHQNSFIRLKQAYNKGFKHVLFNDNYPSGCGSHYTLEHVKTLDSRHSTDVKSDQQLLDAIVDDYYIFPNIFPGKVRTGEGDFDCQSFFKAFTNDDFQQFTMFANDRESYRWNTYTSLKSKEAHTIAS